MKIIFITIVATIINIILFVAITIAIYKAIQGIKFLINRNKELDKKVDTILSKLENKNDN
jgi:predicted tellurium resistance membrane protein TerC